MSMRKKISLAWLPVIAGLISFGLHLGKVSPLLLAAILFVMVIFFLGYVFPRLNGLIALPFASGLLCFLCRFFYWDRHDWMARVENLLLLSLIFALMILIDRLKLVKKFLLFFNYLGLKKRLLVLFLFSEMVFILGSHMIVQGNVGLVGDEAHYLVIAQSIARDGDVNVFNQYARETYRQFIDQHLQSHAKIGKGFKKWYSFHLPGVSLTLAPLFFLKLSPPLFYVLVRSYLGLFAALLVVLAYLFVLKIWKSRSLALWVALVFGFTAPVFFMSIHVFAEVQALLLILSSIYLMVFYGKKSGGWVLLSGALLGASVFWGMKYLIFVVLFIAGFSVHALVKRDYRRIIRFIIFPLLFQLLFFAYLYVAYGNFSPMSIYTGLMSESQASAYYRNVRAISLQNRADTLMDYFFDQRDGLLPYNPIYFFFFPGLILALKKIRLYLPLLLISMPAFVYLLYHGYSTVRPGVCPQARYLVPVVWTLMAFSLVYYRETSNRFFRKLFLVLPVYSVFVTGYQLFHPFTLYQSTTHDQLSRAGLMFQQWGNIHIPLSDLLPSFIKSVPSLMPPFYQPSRNLAYGPNILMLLVLMLLLVVCLLPSRRRRLRNAAGLAFFLFFALFALFPRPTLFNPIQIDKPGVIPHMLHGISFQPRKLAQRKLILNGERSRPVLLSSLMKIPFMLIEVENRGEMDQELEITLFDRGEPPLRIPAGEKVQALLERPRTQKLGPRFYYQFRMEVKPGTPADGKLEVEFKPLKRNPF